MTGSIYETERIMKPSVKLHHIAMTVKDTKESVDWYEKMFGMHVVRTMHIDHTGADITFMGNGDFMIEMFDIPGAAPLPDGRSHPDTDNAVMGLKHYCIYVDNNKEFVADLVSKGVNVAFEFQPGDETTYAAFINDPTGNVIEVFDTKNIKNWKE